MPYDRLRIARKKAVGAKQTLRAVEKGSALVVFVASDADRRITEEVIRECQMKGIPTESVDSMLSLGRACGIQVGAAAVAIIEE